MKIKAEKAQLVLRFFGFTSGYDRKR